tara:strand:- start:790 stop:1719 length:930 start_codon:yes stop_codon:yes gene_type:complete
MLSTNHDVSFTDNLEFFARQVVEGFLTGLHKSPYHGFSVEFAEHRLYNQGDSVKNIDWKLFGRSDKLFVKKFEEETNLRSYILIDTSSSMRYPNIKNQKEDFSKLSFSLYSAACLMHLFQKQRDGFGLTFYSDKLDFFSAAKSNKSHYNRLMGEVEKMLKTPHNQQSKSTNFSTTIADFIEKIPKRSLIIIFSDMMNFESESIDNLLKPFQHLRYRKNEVVLFHVQDLNHEKMFNFSNHPHEFIDLENQKSIQLNPSSYKKIYGQLYNEFQMELELYCHQYKVDYVPAFIQNGFHKVLLSYLTKRSKLF